MRANEVIEQPQKKTYVKPELVTHGSVQQLTEGGHSVHPSHDSGSNLRAPDGEIFSFKGW